MKDTRPTKQEMISTIEDLYFDKLENEGIDFLEYQTEDQGYTFPSVKDEFNVSVKEMIDYIWGLNTYQGQWALANIS